MKLHNTFTGGKEEFSPLRPGEVSMYACGPTVYDEPHIGHLRSAYVFDVARKALRFLGNKVTFVRNVTDVDDKIIDRARQDKVPAPAVAEKYLKSYHEALDRFGIEKPDVEPKATEHIGDMKKIIAALIQKGHAYASAGSVYFRVRAFKPYGDLSHRKNLDELFQNTRKEAGEGKEDPFDFALWKRADDEPSWDSPWGKGRPGWHIECSAMSTKYLGETFDIHGGGLDLLFPHHENERAQSMAASGKEFARVWMHHGLVTVDGQKMSKSLKNFITLEAVLEGFPADALKLFFLQSHYRSDVDFTWNKLASFEEALNSFLIFFSKSDARQATPRTSDKHEREFKSAIEDDFDTPGALRVLFEALREGNKMLTEGNKGEAADVGAWIVKQSKLFGLFEVDDKSLDVRWMLGQVDWKEAHNRVVKLMNEKRNAKQFHISDFIRSELDKLGFKIENRKDGTTAMPITQLNEKDMANQLERLLNQAKAMK